jgi:hypothetical protein
MPDEHLDVLHAAQRAPEEVKRPNCEVDSTHAHMGCNSRAIEWGPKDLGHPGS